VYTEAYTYVVGHIETSFAPGPKARNSKWNLSKQLSNWKARKQDKKENIKPKSKGTILCVSPEAQEVSIGCRGYNMNSDGSDDGLFYVP